MINIQAFQADPESAALDVKNYGHYVSVDTGLRPDVKGVMGSLWETTAR